MQKLASLLKSSFEAHPKIIKHIFLACSIAFFVVTSMAVPTESAEIDILIDKLVEKGILTETEARDILQETKIAAEKEHKKIVQETTQALTSGENSIALTVVPDWIRRTKFKGDLRLRYQMNKRNPGADRHRGRFRLRLGFFTEITDKVHVGFGLASGGSNPRSANHTLGNSFETADIRLDYAYASYQPWTWLTLKGGKFKNPLWLTSQVGSTSAGASWPRRVS